MSIKSIFIKKYINITKLVFNFSVFMTIPLFYFKISYIFVYVIKNEKRNIMKKIIYLLFCFFAEDTNIFEKSLFTHSINNHTQEDGSDLHTHFDRLFQVMNTPDAQRGNIPAFLNSFPYVNGGLFRNQHPIPQFSRKSRTAIIESGETPPPKPKPKTRLKKGKQVAKHVQVKRPVVRKYYL